MAAATTAIRSPSSSSLSTTDETPLRESSPSSVGSSVIGADTYPGQSIPGYAEKPFDEQLEPIAVVGMGESKLTRLRHRHLKIGD